MFNPIKTPLYRICQIFLLTLKLKMLWGTSQVILQNMNIRFCFMWASVLLHWFNVGQTKYNAFCNTCTFLIQLSSLRAWYVSLFTLDGSSAALTWSRNMNTVYKQMLLMTQKHTNIIYNAGFYFIKQVFKFHYRCLNYFTYRLFSKKINANLRKNILINTCSLFINNNNNKQFQF